jgi:tripartite-type tricarboxylate transporter receptor subunit TctC
MPEIAHEPLPAACIPSNSSPRRLRAVFIVVVPFRPLLRPHRRLARDGKRGACRRCVSKPPDPASGGFRGRRADRHSGALGQNVVVENKPGAGGMLATRDVLSQPSDGYTLLLCTHFESINTVLYRNPLYALRDVAPISLIAKYYYGLALSNAIPATTFEQFVAYAKAHPGEVGYISIGIGSAQEILARQLERLTGMSMNRIPYRGGPQVMQDLLSGIVHFYVAPTLQVLPQYESQHLKILAVSSPQRLDVAPEIPTLVEKGIDFVRYGWLGICARAGTPPPIMELLHRNVVAIVAMPEYQAMITKAGSIPISSSPAELADVLSQTVDDVAATIREFGMQQDQ